MVCGRKGLGVDKIIGQSDIAKFIAPHLHRIIDHLFLCPTAVLLQHLATVTIGKNRLNSRRDIAGIQADRAGWSNRRQKRVTNAIAPDGVAHVLIHQLHGTAFQIGLGIKQGKRALFLGQIHRSQIGCTGNGMQPCLGLRCSRVRAIAQTNHQQRICQSRHPQPNAPFVARLLRLRLKRKS